MTIKIRRHQSNIILRGPNKLVPHRVAVVNWLVEADGRDAEYQLICAIAGVHDSGRTIDLQSDLERGGWISQLLSAQF